MVTRTYSLFSVRPDLQWLVFHVIETFCEPTFSIQDGGGLFVDLLVGTHDLCVRFVGCTKFNHQIRAALREFLMFASIALIIFFCRTMVILFFGLKQ